MESQLGIILFMVQVRALGKCSDQERHAETIVTFLLCETLNFHPLKYKTVYSQAKLIYLLHIMPQINFSLTDEPTVPHLLHFIIAQIGTKAWSGGLPGTSFENLISCSN